MDALKADLRYAEVAVLSSPLSVAAERLANALTLAEGVLPVHEVTRVLHDVARAVAHSGVDITVDVISATRYYPS